MNTIFRHGWDLYIEPKAIDGRQISHEFHVVWVPKASFSQIAMRRQTVSGVVGLARIAGKYGLRCRAADSHYASGTKLTFLVGPVPGGTLKQSLVATFKEMKWEARPLQAAPAGREFSGVMWKVHALCTPPHNVLYLANGKAVITRVNNQISQPVPNLKPALGPVAFVNLGTRVADPSQKLDPMQMNDPWAAYKSKAVNPASVVAPDALAALEKKVTSNIIAQLSKDGMELDGDCNTERVERLESQVEALHEQQTKLQGLIHDNANTQQAQIVQVQSSSLSVLLDLGKLHILGQSLIEHGPLVRLTQVG